jgi:hypothetical protein
MRPVTPDGLVEELADLIADRADQLPAGWVRVAVDGAEAADPDRLADALVDPVRLRGHEVVRVRAAEQLRPASLWYERGRTDPDSYFDDWLDTDGLRREVLDPLEPGGTGAIRPRRWDRATDRAARTGFITVPAGGVVILSGPLLLGRWLPFELTVHLELSPAALARRTPPERAWTLPAHARYADDVDPVDTADVVVRLDDPRHPAVRSSRSGS